MSEDVGMLFTFLSTNVGARYSFGLWESAQPSVFDLYSRSRLLLSVVGDALVWPDQRWETTSPWLFGMVSYNPSQVCNLYNKQCIEKYVLNEM